MAKPELGVNAEPTYFSSTAGGATHSVGGMSRLDCLEQIERILGRSVDGLNTLERSDLKSLLLALWEQIPGARAAATGDRASQ